MMDNLEKIYREIDETEMRGDIDARIFFMRRFYAYTVEELDQPKRYDISLEEMWDIIDNHKKLSVMILTLQTYFSENFFSEDFWVDRIKPLIDSKEDLRGNMNSVRKEYMKGIVFNFHIDRGYELFFTFRLSSKKGYGTVLDNEDSNVRPGGINNLDVSNVVRTANDLTMAGIEEWMDMFAEDIFNIMYDEMSNEWYGV